MQTSAHTSTIAAVQLNLLRVTSLVLLLELKRSTLMVNPYNFRSQSTRSCSWLVPPVMIVTVSRFWRLQPMASRLFPIGQTGVRPVLNLLGMSDTKESRRFYDNVNSTNNLEFKIKRSVRIREDCLRRPAIGVISIDSNKGSVSSLVVNVENTGTGKMSINQMDC